MVLLIFIGLFFLKNMLG